MLRISLGRNVIAAGAALALTACGSAGDQQGAGTDDLRRLTIGRIPASVYTPVELGIANGYFEEQGIDVELVNVQGAGPAVSGVESGSIDMFNNTPVVAASANQSGSDLRAFCAGSTQTVFFLAQKNSSIPTATNDNWQKSVRAWKGKTIGIPALGGNAEFLAKDLLVQAGLKADDAKVVAVGAPNEAAVEQLTKGEVDLLYSWPYFTESLRERTKVALPLSMVGPEQLVNQPAALWTASEAWLDKNAELATDFCAAYGDLIDQTTDPANRDEVQQLLISQGSVPREEAPKVLEAALGDGGGLTILTKELECEAVKDALALSVASGVLKKEAVQDCDRLVWKAP